MRQSIVGVFRRHEHALRAAALLRDTGFAPDSVQVTESSYGEGDEIAASEHPGSALVQGIRKFFAGVFGELHDLGGYADAVQRGGAVVKIDIDEADARLDIARDTLQTAGALVIEERPVELRPPADDGVAGGAPVAGNGSAA
jgi:hypothetical protein